MNKSSDSKADIKPEKSNKVDNASVTEEPKKSCLGTLKGVRWGFVFGLTSIAMFVMLWFVTCDNKQLEKSNLRLSQSLVAMDLKLATTEAKLDNIILEKDRHFTKSVKLFDESLDGIGSALVSAESALQLLANQIDAGKESVQIMTPATGDKTIDPSAKEIHVIDGAGKSTDEIIGEIEAYKKKISPFLNEQALKALSDSITTVDEPVTAETIPTQPKAEETVSEEPVVTEAPEEVIINDDAIVDVPETEVLLNENVVDGLQAEPYYSVELPSAE